MCVCVYVNLQEIPTDPNGNDLGKVHFSRFHRWFLLSNVFPFAPVDPTCRGLHAWGSVAEALVSSCNRPRNVPQLSYIFYVILADPIKNKIKKKSIVPMFRLVRTSLVSQLLWRPLKWEPTWKKWLWCIYVPLNFNILKFTIDLVPRHRFMSMKAGSDLRPVSQPMTSEYFPQILAADPRDQGAYEPTNIWEAKRTATWGRLRNKEYAPKKSIYTILNLKRWVTAETRFAA